MPLRGKIVRNLFGLLIGFAVGAFGLFMVLFLWRVLPHGGF